MRKVVDARVRQLIENGVAQRHRSMFVMVGDKGRDQVVNLHYMLTKAQTGKSKPKVLWAYKKELGFSSHQQKRSKQIKREIKRGVRDPDAHDPFELFLTSTEIRFCYYKDSHKILGKTFQICVLQDFEALTPNLLARTVETVEGGGLVILLLKTMTSLRAMFTMAMDVHARFRTEAHADVVPRFNERFMLSLAQCQQCLVVDDELNILPLSSHARSMTKAPPGSHGIDQELVSLQQSLSGVHPACEMVGMCKTLDQAQSLMQLINCIQEADTKSVVSLTAGRGRGKSACLGLAIASAVSCGLSNIFVCAPSAENLGTVFDFVFKGFDALDYAEHVDYEILRSKTTGDVVKVNIHRENRRQTIQFIHAKDADKLLNCELLLIDEAAAIPLVLVRELMGPYVTVLSSTINGYEGTGRSLSLKLFAGLRKQRQGVPFVELALEQPIRYGAGDHVEAWLNRVLCLDSQPAPITSAAPHPSTCQLFYVNRDTLFSHHAQSELFLQRVMSLFVTSHYKNTPNDLQMMSDAPAHHLFVLLGPSPAPMPDVLAVVQVALEGNLKAASVAANQSRAAQPSGDLIPWTISQQFQDNDFAMLRGARVVRVAVHPGLQRMGYGTRALSLLKTYFSGQMVGVYNDPVDVATPVADPVSSGDLLTEVIAPRSGLPPILSSLDERAAEHVDYIGTSFGLSQSLMNFWVKASFEPVYLRQTQNEITGEHTIIMLQAMSDDRAWLTNYVADFRRRFIHLLPMSFPSMSVQLALAILSPSSAVVSGAVRAPSEDSKTITIEELRTMFSEYDLRRLEAYSRSMVDYHLILDLVPPIVRLLFQDRLGVAVRTSFTQAALALGLGLQFKSVNQLHQELQIEPNQVLALFNKLIRKVVTMFRSLEEEEVRKTMKTSGELKFAALGQDLNKEMSEAARETQQKLAEKQKALLTSTDLKEYAITQTDDQWAAALPSGGDVVPSSIALPSTKKRKTDEPVVEKKVKSKDKKSKKSTSKKSKQRQ